jgi:hypothetical protein
MTVKLVDIQLPENFATNVLALRGVVDCVKRSNKGGWQSDRCNRKTYPWAADVVDAVNAAAGIDKEITYWYNINTGDDYNEWHDHDKGDSDELCACLYLQVPEGAGDFEYVLNKETIRVKPYVGLLIIFPDDLMHRVLPNTGNGERVSMAFNFWKMLR